MASDGKIFELLQKNSDQILLLVQNTSKLEERIASTKKDIDKIGNSQEDLSIQIRQLTSMMRDKMTPDRCAHLHEEIIKRTKKEIFTEIKQEFKGWKQTAWSIIKIVAAVAVIFGGSATGAQAIGLIKILGR